MTDKLKIKSALALLLNYGQIDGAHHKTWVIDQAVRRLAGTDDEYKKLIIANNAGEDGPETYSWDEGIAP